MYHYSQTETFFHYFYKKPQTSIILASKNPLKLVELSPYGIPILPDQNCSEIRKEYFIRMNRILGSYITVGAFSEAGYRNFTTSNKQNKEINNTTPLRIKRESVIVQSTTDGFSKMFNKASAQLPNQYFLMVYGNFETFVSDLVQKAFVDNGADDPFKETKSLLITSTWESKLQKIRDKFDLDIRGTYINQKYQNFGLDLLGNIYTNPILFLNGIADLRHYLVHSSGRIDKELSKKYPDFSNLEGELILMPFEYPFSFNFFLVLLTDILDNAFCKKFNWERTLIAPAALID